MAAGWLSDTTYISKVGALKLSASSGLVGACLGFAAGFKAAELLYSDEIERKRVGNTVRLVFASAGVTVAIVMLVRVVS
jgi:hypothetical protein